MCTQKVDHPSEAIVFHHASHGEEIAASSGDSDIPVMRRRRSLRSGTLPRASTELLRNGLSTTT